jgi:5-methylcytosine-specific restriction protein A
MAREDVQREDVLAAIEECGEVGREDFLVKYGKGKATVYHLRHDGRDYDSKAIFAAAHEHRTGLTLATLSGGEGDAVKHLRRLGFQVISTRLPWTRDELILACDLLRDNNWKWMSPKRPEVVELSALLNEMPIHPVDTRGPRFRSPDAVVLKMQNIATQHPDYKKTRTNGNALDREVLMDFLGHPDEMRAAAAAIKAGLRSGGIQDSYEAFPDVDDFEGFAMEGRLLERRHFVRERSKSLRERKIKEHLKRNSTLACETCDFDFEAAYGADRGRGYIECHHVVPLHASSEKPNSTGDLILICSNCHRMIHRRNPWLEPDELRMLIRGAREQDDPSDQTRDSL